MTQEEFERSEYDAEYERFKRIMDRHGSLRVAQPPEALITRDGFRRGIIIGIIAAAVAIFVMLQRGTL